MARQHDTLMVLGRCLATALVTVLLVGAAGSAGAQPLRRNVSSYLVLTMKRGSLKNMRVGSPCNVGVNCAAPTPKSKCGVLALGRVTAVDGSQIVADQAFLRKPGAQLWQLFRNDDSPLDNVTLVGPAPNPQPFDAPVIPGTCDDDCNPDYAAMNQACGFPSPVPACDPARPVKIARGADCAPYDTVAGNQQCDLPPGVYGTLVMNDGARLNLQPGTYVLCLFKAGQDTTTTAGGTTIVIPADAPAKNAVKVNNGSLLGADCGDLRFLVDGKTKVSFGRSGVVATEVCAPQAQVSLGHNNVLIGSFVADTVNADLNNFGRCCGGTCACYDTLTPTAAPVGGVVTMSGDCNLEAVTDIRVCGIAATVVTRAPGELRFEVPALAAGACLVEIVSPAGSFVGQQTLAVSG